MRKNVKTLVRNHARLDSTWLGKMHRHCTMVILRTPCVDFLDGFSPGCPSLTDSEVNRNVDAIFLERLHFTYIRGRKKNCVLQGDEMTCCDGSRYALYQVRALYYAFQRVSLVEYVWADHFDTDECFRFRVLYLRNDRIFKVVQNKPFLGFASY